MKNKAKILKRAALIIAIVALVLLFSIFILYVYATVNIDFQNDIMIFESARKWNSTRIFASSNDCVEEIPFDSGLRMSYCKISDFSPKLIEGVLAVEDRDFYNHSGVDIKRTLLAFANYLTKKEKMFGASTVTQQLIKNLSGDSERSIRRKLNEIIRAYRIEKYYSKDEILELYLNIVPMSENVFGIGAASREYFGKTPSELTADETALLIGIINAPSAYNPYTNYESSLKKRNSVLAILKDQAVISESEYTDAIGKNIKLISREEREGKIDSWFVETVVTDVVTDLSLKLNISESAARLRLLGGGYSIFTTMNKPLQTILEQYFSDESNFNSAIKNGLEYSMCVVDSKTGDLVALVGGVGKKSANRILNYATLPHPPASTLKPIALYAPLIDKGLISWSTVFDDVPVSFSESDGALIPYPKNSPDVYSGLTTVKDAVRLSKNTVAIRVCKLFGVDNVYDTLIKNYSFEALSNTRDRAIAPMALGQLTYGISLRDLTAAYSAFPREGIYGKARSYTKLTDYSGNTVIDNMRDDRRIYKKSTSEIINQLLHETVSSGTAQGLNLGQKVMTAGKTGTSGGGKDKLFVGYTPYYTAGIWSGYRDGSKSVSGFNPTHLEIWDDVMNMIHDEIGYYGEAEFSTDEIIRLPYCMDSGGLYCDKCRYDPRGSRIEYGYFAKDGNIPRFPCDVHILCNYDGDGKGMANYSCDASSIAKVALLDISTREFPTEVYITDAEFVYRGDYYGIIPDNETDLPYFYHSLPEGLYVGISKRKKHFNRPCRIHAGI